MNPADSKKRKRESDDSFLVERHFILSSLGYYDEKNVHKIALRESFENRFRDIVHMPAHGQPSMNILEFTNDCLSRGYSARFASAGFRLLVDNGDLIWDNEVCRLLSITLEEYVAFRLCLPPFYPPPLASVDDVLSEDMCRVQDILQRWHHRLILYMYDKDGTGSLQQSELRNLVTDMVHADQHVDEVMRKLCPNGINPADTGFFVEDLSKHESISVLHSHHCSLLSLLNPRSMIYSTRSAVLDTRAITSQIPSGMTIPPPRSRLASMMHGVHSLNPTEVHLPESMCPLSDWRGLLVNRSSAAFEIANIVVANAHRMMLRTYSENDVQDSEWMTPGSYPSRDTPTSTSSNTNSTTSSTTDGTDTISGDETGAAPTAPPPSSLRSTNDRLRCLNELLAGPSDHDVNADIDVKPMLWKIACLCADAKRIMSAQPIVLKVPQPCKVFGDIHGQFRDLLLLFREYGFPNNQGGDVDAVKYIFDGDFVDRGAHQLEVVVLLFALKVAYPGCVFLLRGNHEMRDQNIAMGNLGFFAACRKMFKVDYADKLFLLVHMVFDWLPLAAVVAQHVLVLHGGIGDGAWTLAELGQLQRPIGHDFMTGTESGTRAHALLVQVLWSDPSDGHDDANPGVHCNERGKGIMTFSNDITQSFCQLNNLTHIIRAHQYVARGYKILHGGRVVTVFSARNYFDRVQNDSAIILISEDEEGNLRLKPKTLLRRLSERVPL